jgi:putrescine aminotransferase
MNEQSHDNYTHALRTTAMEHHLPPFTDHVQMAKEGGPRIIEKAEGCYLWDTEGNRYLDGMAGLWCVNVGYGRDRLAEVAFEQMKELPYYNSFFKTATPASVYLSEAVSSLLPDHLNQIHFVNSGSEANDTIVRMVRHYYNLLDKPQKKVFISRTNAYHGSTMAAASLGGMAGMHAQGDLPLPGFEHVAQPYWYAEGGDLSPEEFGLLAAKSVEDKILELGADNVAAFIGEPVQGAGGVIIPPETYWPEINRICKKYDVLIIADEVICGFGRTGNWFGLQTFGIEADLVPMAKGLSSGYLPIGAVAVSDRIANTLKDKGGEFAHGMTYSGHPVACAVAVENIKIMQEEKLIERVGDDLAGYLGKALSTLDDLPLVGETRSVGLLGAIELVADKSARRKFDPVGNAGGKCRDHCFDLGLVIRACGDTMVMSPPFVINHEQIDDLVRMARTAIERTSEELAG